MEAYALIIAAAAAFGGYSFGLGGDSRRVGITASILAAFAFVIPMGFWLASNLIAYAFKGGGSGFKPGQVREVFGLLLFGAAVWLCATAVGYVLRTRGKR
ncbi:putative integral membrane protein [Mesorhizobium opportunistum WSM2075]|uniref:Integral membrane protein n=1 Tax=Mesorhizobium opportunistum (strain LMG 24607 / HAMBI 3007 / WSM2075) TaxID=536019 RepID=F7YCA9_MESOW|nr:putative integral membrane protein [Mesorhizobium opportunistum WSM2075]